MIIRIDKVNLEYDLNAEEDFQLLKKHSCYYCENSISKIVLEHIIHSFIICAYCKDHSNKEIECSEIKTFDLNITFEEILKIITKLGLIS